MSYIKEPVGVNFIVDPTPLTLVDRKKISEIITYYKATGKMMPVEKSKKKASRIKINRKSIGLV